jgi:hypothetical protein
MAKLVLLNKKNLDTMDRIIAEGNVMAFIAEGTPLPADEAMIIIVGNFDTSNPLRYFN